MIRNRLARKKEVLIIVILNILLLAITMSVAIIKRFSTLDPRYIFSVATDLIGMIVLTIVLFSNLLDEQASTKANLLLCMMLLGNDVAFSTDAISWLVNGAAEHYYWNLWMNTFFYMTGFWISLLYLHYVLLLTDREWNSLGLIILSIVEVEMMIANLNRGFVFKIDANGFLVRGEYFFASLVPSGILLLVAVFAVIRSGLIGKTKAVLILYPMIPAVCCVLQYFTYGYSFMYLGNMIALLIIYMSVYVTRGKELAYRHSILVGHQLQPAFLQSTVNSILRLMQTDSDRAVKSMNYFSELLDEYTRMDSEMEFVPVKDAIRTADRYLYLQRMILGETFFSYEFNLECTSFVIPRYTLLTLLENAVNYGIKNRPEFGGVIRVNTRQTDTNYILEVIDNGIGFEPRQHDDNVKPQRDLINIRYRVEKLCKGNVDCISSLGDGTAVMVSLPKRTMKQIGKEVRNEHEDTAGTV